MFLQQSTGVHSDLQENTDMTTALRDLLSTFEVTEYNTGKDDFMQKIVQIYFWRNVLQHL